MEKKKSPHMSAMTFIIGYFKVISSVSRRLRVNPPRKQTNSAMSEHFGQELSSGAHVVNKAMIPYATVCVDTYGKLHQYLLFTSRKSASGFMKNFLLQVCQLCDVVSEYIGEEVLSCNARSNGRTDDCVGSPEFLDPKTEGSHTCPSLSPFDPVSVEKIRLRAEIGDVYSDATRFEH
ncbi:unnamed protein product [Hymenolepis diminuta]|uniref:Uncharacterized protein n=1 Tax=Hymenolepis diminuta TaxID=6216 RepID=A0A564Z4X4_HYMDI|nr:unnamed protein product [Hymenolepis diminuta]